MVVVPVYPNTKANTSNSDHSSKQSYL